MRRPVVSADTAASIARRRPSSRAVATAALLSIAFATLACAGAARAETARATGGMKALGDDELSAVRGADGIAFNLNNFSLTSSLTNPLTLTYQSPNGSSLSLAGLNLSRTDDPDGGFGDPYYLTLYGRSGLPAVLALDFPLNVAATQKWSLTADFSNYDAASNTTFNGGTLQVGNLTMMGGGVYLAPSVVAATDGIAFGLGTRLDIGSLGIYSHGRTNGVIDTSDSLMFTGIHLFDANTQGAWMLADVTAHPGLINAITDANGSYLHVQIGWPTTSAPVTSGALQIDNITFTPPAGGIAPTVNLGSASIASMQLNYVDIKFKTGP